MVVAYASGGYNYSDCSVTWLATACKRESAGRMHTLTHHANTSSGKWNNFNRN